LAGRRRRELDYRALGDGGAVDAQVLERHAGGRPDGEDDDASERSHAAASLSGYNRDA